MSRVCALFLFGAMFVLAGGLVGQEPKKDDPKKEDPAAKVKGTLPKLWGKIGLSEEQKQNVYKVKAKYYDEIEKLESKVRELKATEDKELKAILTP